MSLDEQNEQVARFIAQYRSGVAIFSICSIDGFIRDLLCGRDFFKTEKISKLRELQPNLFEIIRKEDELYWKLLRQDIIMQFYRIRGVQSAEVRIDEERKKHFVVVMQTHHADKWEWTVDMDMDMDMTSAGRTFRFGYPDATRMLEDGTCFFEDVMIPTGKFLGPSHYVCPVIIPDMDDYKRLFGNLIDDIRKDLLTGEFVSAFQKISLALHGDIDT